MVHSLVWQQDVDDRPQGGFAVVNGLRLCARPVCARDGLAMPAARIPARLMPAKAGVAATWRGVGG